MTGPVDGPSSGVVPPPESASRRVGRLVGLAVAVAGLVLVAVAISRNQADRTTDVASSPSTSTTGPAVPATVAASATAPTTPAGIGVGWAPAIRGRRLLRGFSEVSATITAGDGTTCHVCLMAATTDAQRERGLMEVTDPALGGYDGMLFQFSEVQHGAFWMYDTPMPLSIAYFAPGGRLVAQLDMAPCGKDEHCPGYPAGKPFGFALEVPRGRLDDVGVVGAARIRVDALRCPLAEAAG